MMVLKHKPSYIVKLARPTYIFWYCVRVVVSTYGECGSFNSMGCFLVDWIDYSTDTATIVHHRGQSGIFLLDAVFPAH